MGSAYWPDEARDHDLLGVFDLLDQTLVLVFQGLVLLLQ
jgi:hypothetical protein